VFQEVFRAILSFVRFDAGISVRYFLKRRGKMPHYDTAFSGMASDRKLTKTELYMQLAESTDNELAGAVLRDIAEEELVHAGEFLRLLKELEPEEENFYKKGALEVEEFIEKLGMK
jgi:rubrerythrin